MEMEVNKKINLLVGMMIGTLVMTMMAYGFGGFIMQIVLQNSDDNKLLTTITSKNVNESKAQAIENSKQIDDLDNRLSSFVNKSDVRFKTTQAKLDNSYQEILRFQNVSNQTGQQVIKKFFLAEDNIIGNLTRHRIVTNISIDHLDDKLDKLLASILTNNRLLSVIVNQTNR